MSDAKSIMNIIKEKEIQFVDLRFTDPRGKMQHLSQHVSTIDEKSLAEGFMFDGSSRRAKRLRHSSGGLGGPPPDGVGAVQQDGGAVTAPREPGPWSKRLRSSAQGAAS